MVSTPTFDEDLEYELTSEGRLVLIRSLEATRPLYLRFRNASRTDVEVCWRDYAGHRRVYVVLEPGAHYDVNTYATHPWQFSERRTRERYVINNRVTFRPPPQPGQFRVNWNITPGVRTLRHTALLAVAYRLVKPTQAVELGLPRALEVELAKTVYVLTKDEPPQEH